MAVDKEPIEGIIVTQKEGEEGRTVYMVEDRSGNAAGLEWWEWEAVLQAVRNQREATHVTVIDTHGNRTGAK